jgi:DNA-binding winged helix-turn-helix (wHTH) protein/tetratricopeptide (TPR) repeat protein
MANGPRQLRVGDYVIEPLAGIIRGSQPDSQPHHLQPKIMAVLVFLAERAGDVVTRDEIIETVWGRPVTDDVLTRAIHELRVAFDDKAGAPAYIETIPKIGYRLCAIVLPVDSDGKREGEKTDERGAKRSDGMRYVPLLLGALIVIGLLAWWNMDGGPGESTAAQGSVVLAPFEDFTDDSRLADALDIAFRTGIEQSPRISIIPPITIAAALERMQLGANATIDRDTAIEISLREQAKAVIIGSIANIGASYRISGEILEPTSGETVFAFQSAVVEEDQILQGLDEVVTAIRQQSGEALSAIEANFVPLERVTTANFEALEAYSIGMRHSGMADLETSIPFFREAIRLDPSFAMAYAKLGFVQSVSTDNNEEALFNLGKALELRNRLTHREQLYVEALRAQYDAPDAMKEAWTLLIHSYPNYAEGYRSLGNVYLRYDNDFEKSAEQLRIAVQIPDLWNSVAHHNLGFALLGLGESDKALEHFRKAYEESGHPMGIGLGNALIAVRDYDAAEAFLLENISHPSDNVRRAVELTYAILHLDQGRLSEAVEVLERMRGADAGVFGARHQGLAATCAILERSVDPTGFQACLREVIDAESELVSEGYFRRRYWPSGNLAMLGKVAARNGLHQEAQDVFALVRDDARSSGFYFIESYNDILNAELMISDGEYADALRILRRLVADRPLFQARESLARAYALAGDNDAAIAAYKALLEARGQAFSEHMSRRFGNEFHILDWIHAHLALAQLFEDSGRPDLAVHNYEAFLTHWSNADNGLPAILLARDRLDALQALSAAIPESVSGAARNAPD